MRNVPLTLFALFMALNARVAAAQCTTWKNDLDACNILNVDICSNPVDWSASDADKVNQWEYDDDPKVVCHEYWEKWDLAHYTQFNKQIFETATTDPANFNCYLDVAGDQHTTSAYVTQVHSGSVPVADVDYCCTLTPHGPYETLAPPGARGTRGTDFTSSVQADVKGANHTRNAAAIAASGSNKFGYRSDAKTANIPPTQAVGVDTWDFLAFAPSFIWSAEVDHIIPKKDSHGCPCGSNAFANAEVISKSLNSSTQNSCVDPRRVKILRAYTNYNTVIGP